MVAARRWWRGRDRGVPGGPPNAPAVTATWRILSGDANPSADELRATAAELRKLGQRGLERRLLAVALDRSPDDVELRQRLALATYQDEDQPVGPALDHALELLSADLRDDQETLS